MARFSTSRFIMCVFFVDGFLLIDFLLIDFIFTDSLLTYFLHLKEWRYEFRADPKTTILID